MNAPFDQSASPFGVVIPFANHLGIRLVETTKDRSIVALDRRPEISNSLGAMHGGAIMTMLDLVMTIAVRAHYGVAGGVITIDMTTSFIRPSTGTVFAEARVLNGGKSMAFCEAEAKDESGKLLVKAMGTFRLVEKKE
jgi:uncharacterized protein (TIGR00369 family)